MLVEVLEAFGGQGRPGGTQAAQGGEIPGIGQHQTLLATRDVVRGGPAEERDGLLRRQAPQGGGVGVQRVAVQTHQGGPEKQGGKHIVPHHPAGGREPEQLVLGAHVVEEAEQLEVLDQHPTVAMHDGLGQPGGAGGVQHVKRMIEGHRVEQRVRRVSAFGVGKQLRPRDRPLYSVDIGLQVVQHHGGGDGGQRSPNGRHFFDPVHVLFTKAVAVDHEQHLGLDLAEPVHHRAGTELRGAGGPDGPQAGGGQEGHHRLGHVGQVGRHPVSRHHPGPAQPRPAARHLLGQLAVGEGGAGPGLGAPYQRHPVPVGRLGGYPQDGARVVDRGAFEPAGPWHHPRRQYRLVWGGRLDVKIAPDRRPEGGWLCHGPLPQLLVTGEGADSLVSQPGHVATEIARSFCLFSRFPQQIPSSHGRDARRIGP